MTSPPRQTTREQGEGGGGPPRYFGRDQRKNIKPFIDVDVFYMEKRLRALFQWEHFSQSGYCAQKMNSRMMLRTNPPLHDGDDKDNRNVRVVSAVIMEWCDSDAIWDVPPRRIIRTGMSLDRGLPVGYCCCGCCINHHPVSRDENNGRVGSFVRVVKNLPSADGYRMSTLLDDTNWKNGVSAKKDVADSYNVFTAQGKNTRFRGLRSRRNMVAAQCRFDRGGE